MTAAGGVPEREALEDEYGHCDYDDERKKETQEADVKGRIKGGEVAHIHAV